MLLMRCIPELSALRRYAADPEALIDVQASDVPLMRIAEWFEYLFPHQILVPESQIRDRVTTTATGIKVGDFIKGTGLIPKKRAFARRKFTEPNNQWLLAFRSAVGSRHTRQTLPTEAEIERLLERGRRPTRVGTSIKIAWAVMPKCSSNYRRGGL